MAYWVETAGDDLTEVAKDYEKQCQQARIFFFLTKLGGVLFVGWCFFLEGEFCRKKQNTHVSWGWVLEWIFPPTLSLFFQDKLPFNAAAPKEEILRLTKVGDPEMFDPFWLLWLVWFTSLSMYIYI